MLQWQARGGGILGKGGTLWSSTGNVRWDENLCSHIDEWCGTYPGRFIPCVLPAIWDPDVCAAEVRRADADLDLLERSLDVGNTSLLEAVRQQPVENAVWLAAADAGGATGGVDELSNELWLALAGRR